MAERVRAREEGIVLTPEGVPLFQRDMARWADIRSMAYLPEKRLAWQVAPEDDGQAIDVAYAVNEEGYVRRIKDRAAGTTKYETLSWDNCEGPVCGFDPRNGILPRGPWREAL